VSCPACEAQRKANHHRARADRLEPQLRELAHELERLRNRRRRFVLAARALNQLAETKDHRCEQDATLERYA
jgi:hypothetical protein